LKLSQKNNEKLGEKLERKFKLSISPTDELLDKKQYWFFTKGGG
jgi:hypothetical protein